MSCASEDTPTHLLFLIHNRFQARLWSRCAPIVTGLPLRVGPGEVTEWLKVHAWKACVR